MSDVGMSTSQVSAGDVTLNLSHSRSRKLVVRQRAAWNRFADHEGSCPFCHHASIDHVFSSGQPHFFRSATEAESDGPGRLYVHPDYGLLKRLSVAKEAEVLRVYCAACAEEKATVQVVCFIRTWGTGEVVGVAASGD